MTDIHNSSPGTPGIGFGRRAWRRDWFVLPDRDYQHLRQHLDDCETTRPDGWVLLAHVLLHKLMTTRPDMNAGCPDLATGGCRVTFSLDGGQPRSGLLSHSVGPGTDGEVIPVASLLGATLIGMRVGQRAPLLRDDGMIGTVSMLGVARPHAEPQPVTPQARHDFPGFRLSQRSNGG